MNFKNFSTQSFVPVGTAIPTPYLEEDLTLLSPSARLLETGDYIVYMTLAADIPHIIKEIGRLREQANREVGEGSEKPYFLDERDQYFYQLFTWNKREKKIISGYRVGLADRILSQYGYSGLSLSSLFKFNPLLIELIATGIELGRVFIIKEYQKKAFPLVYLWKGLCRFLVMNPIYTGFFGAVSVSSAYQPLTLDLIVETFQHYYIDKNFSEYIQPIISYAAKKVPKYLNEKLMNLSPGQQTIKMLDVIIRNIENNHKGLPDLFRIYLNFGSKFYGFALNPVCNNSLDFFCVCNMKDVPQKKRIYFFGKIGEESYANYHNSKDE